jgi:hypothetical protein
VKLVVAIDGAEASLTLDLPASVVLDARERLLGEADRAKARALADRIGLSLLVLGSSSSQALGLSLYADRGLIGMSSWPSICCPPRSGSMAFSPSHRPQPPPRAGRGGRLHLGWGARREHGGGCGLCEGEKAIDPERGGQQIEGHGRHADEAAIRVQRQPERL